MPENTVFVRHFQPEEIPAVHEREVWRYAGYAGVPEQGDALRRLYGEAAAELEPVLSYQVCFRRMPITWQGDMPDLPFASRSKNLAKCLSGSGEIVLFAATIGLETDRRIARYKHLSPTKALLMQALGAERVEALCDAFCAQIRDEAQAEGLSCTARFSPGYGDLPLETQREWFTLLDCNRKIGVSLGETLLMTPSKSVTAVFGLGCGVGAPKTSKCQRCAKTDCAFRHTGTQG